MAETRKRNMLVILAMGLLVAALWPAMSFGQTSQDKPQPQQRPERPWMGRLAKELNLTPEQQKTLEEMRKARLEEFKTSRGQIVKARQQLREFMKDPKANEAKLDGLFDQISKARADQAKAALKSRLEWQKVFTAEQLEKMKAFRAQFESRLGGRFGFAGRGGFGRGFGFRHPGMGPFMRFHRPLWPMFHSWWLF